MDVLQLRATRGEFQSADQLYRRTRSDDEFRHGIESLYFEVFARKLNKSCSNCWFDAYMELVSLPIERFLQQQKCRFSLRAGALLTDVNDHSKMASNANLTDELALHHLRVDPSCKRLFTKPDEAEIDSLIKSFAASEATEVKAGQDANM